MSKPYIRPIPATWWLERRAYFLFMLREISSVFVALYVLELLCLLALVADTPAADAASRAERIETFIETLGSPLWIVFHVVALAFSLYHSTTWFNLTPKVMVVRIGENKLPDLLIAGSNYAVWLVVSVVVWWIIV